MEGTLRVSPEELMGTANEFGTCGTAIRNITSSMTDIVAGLNTDFVGEDASAYMAKFNGLQNDINRIHAKIQEHVTDLNEMARVYIAARTANISDAQDLPNNVI